MLYLNVTLIDNDTCLISQRINKTIIGNVYSGIPGTIVLNVISWLLLILLFATLRKQAWNYGRLALIPRQTWTRLFFKGPEETMSSDESHTDRGCLWFLSLFKISKKTISDRCGPDAVHYLSFQTQLLWLMLIITLFSIMVILPINFQGTLLGDKKTFGRTTIGNLPADFEGLWVHVLGSICIVPLMVLLMRKCSGRTPSSSALSAKTIMITNISQNQRNIEGIKYFLLERYPSIEIESITLAYRVKRLSNLERQRKKVYEARMYCLDNADVKIRPYWGIICCLCNRPKALDYYTKKEEELNELVRVERDRVLESPLGIAFVTLNTKEMAQHVLNSFKLSFYRSWVISKAPTPSDINWENLEVSYRNWYCKTITVNSSLFLVLFLLTTPVNMANFFNSLTNAKEHFINKLGPFLSKFLPTLFLLSISALMPVTVAYSDKWLHHWTKSEQNHATMCKTFFFLLFMVLILPSLGLTSARAFVEYSIDIKHLRLRWECIFLADNGAFFVNYVITSAFMGTSLELLRFPELAMYTWRLLRIKSKAEKSTIREEILSEFPFGFHYAWTLLIFTVSTVYSLTCPLITPFGLLYLLLKHLVDKHNIYYVYKDITMSHERQVHGDAVRMVQISILLLQVITALFFFLRGISTVKVFFVVFGFVATSGYFFFFGLSPSCIPPSGSLSNLQDPSENYVAPVLTTSRNIGPVDIELSSNIVEC